VTTTQTHSSVVASVREALLLEHAMRAVRSYPDGARVTALARAGGEAALLADRALDDGYLASALALYREAALQLMAAAVVAAPGGGPVADPLPRTELLARFREGGRRGPTSFEAFSASLETERPVGAPPARSEVEDARDNVRWLGTLVEARGLPELRFERGLRVGLSGVLAVAALAWVASSLGSGNNVALHKPVTASGLFNSSIVPAGLTDGVIAGAPWGIHTKVGGSPWVQVDLGKVYAIDKIDVYNRGDAYFDEGLPMTLQLSEDGVTFSDLEKRTTSFSQSAPWVAKANGRKARYVRVTGALGKYVTLSELEVYAQ
jgi:hypothetical protein